MKFLLSLLLLAVVVSGKKVVKTTPAPTTPAPTTPEPTTLAPTTAAPTTTAAPLPTCSDPNEEYNRCGKVCDPKCSDGDSKFNTEECDTKYCQGRDYEGGCRCKEGYVRRERFGPCVLHCDCPSCGKNEFYSCGSPCDKTCDNLGLACNIASYVCVEQCYCMEGYARDDKGVCVPTEHCPPRQCSKRERFFRCADICPLEITCADQLAGNTEKACSVPDPAVCEPQCKCDSGYVRSILGGQCVRTEKCCEIVDPYSEYAKCTNACAGGTCASPAYEKCGKKCGPAGCQCKQGALRNADGRCIPASKCPCNDPNEVFSAKYTTARFCFDHPEKTIGCICKSGFVYKSSTDRTCIKKKECVPPCPQEHK